MQSKIDFLKTPSFYFLVNEALITKILRLAGFSEGEIEGKLAVTRKYFERQFLLSLAKIFPKKADLDEVKTETDLLRLIAKAEAKKRLQFVNEIINKQISFYRDLLNYFSEGERESFWELIESEIKNQRQLWKKTKTNK